MLFDPSIKPHLAPRPPRRTRAARRPVWPSCRRSPLVRTGQHPARHLAPARRPRNHRLPFLRVARGTCRFRRLFALQRHPHTRAPPVQRRQTNRRPRAPSLSRGHHIAHREQSPQMRRNQPSRGIEEASEGPSDHPHDRTTLFCPIPSRDPTGIYDRRPVPCTARLHSPYPFF